MNYIDALQLECSYADLSKKFYTPINPIPVNKPKLIIFNEKLAKSLNINLPYDDKETLAQLFSGNRLPKKSNPIAPWA